MRISVTAPIEQALNHTKAMLFDDFRFKMWLGLGFCAFLANMQLTFPNASGDGFEGTGLEDWAKANPELLIVLIIIGMLTGFLLWLLLLWLQSRGKFMFLDGVLNNSGAIKEPWRRFKFLGNNLLLFQVLLFISFAIVVAIESVVCIGGVALAGNAAEAIKISGIAMVVIGALALILTVCGFVFFMMVLDTFLVPTMYRRNLRALDAWGVLRREVLGPHFGKIVLFFLMAVLLGLASFIIAMIGIVATCCIGALPYISSVLFLPLFVFFRLYSIYFLEQFGPDWWFFAREETATAGGPAATGEFESGGTAEENPLWDTGRPDEGMESPPNPRE